MLVIFCQYFQKPLVHDFHFWFQKDMKRDQQYLNLCRFSSAKWDATYIKWTL